MHISCPEGTGGRAMGDSAQDALDLRTSVKGEIFTEVTEEEENGSTRSPGFSREEIRYSQEEPGYFPHETDRVKSEYALPLEGQPFKDAVRVTESLHHTGNQIASAPKLPSTNNHSFRADNTDINPELSSTSSSPNSINYQAKNLSERTAGPPIRPPYKLFNSMESMVYPPMLRPGSPTSMNSFPLPPVSGLMSMSFDATPSCGSPGSSNFGLPGPSMYSSFSNLVSQRRRRQEARDREKESVAATVTSGMVQSSEEDDPDSKKAKTVPDEKKDDAYWERRRKNNEAAKRSRDARRQKEEEIAMRAAFLEQENLKLRAQVAVLKNETAKLHYLLYNRG